MWTNNYIGIPYVDKGRNTSGTDCWGLVRLVYSKELGIELPSFHNEYTVSDTDRLAELFSQHKEGWDTLTLPTEKCVVLFRVLGKISHIGIMVNEHQFLHTKRNQDSSIDSINNPKWANRLAGFYSYNEKSLSTHTTPLALQEVQVEVPEGFTVGDAFAAVYVTEKIPKELTDRIILFVDGVQVYRDQDGWIPIENGQKLEYRLIPNDDNTLRTLVTIAVIIIAAQLGDYTKLSLVELGPAMSSAAGAVVTAGVMAVGMSLVNSIFPIRPPDGSTSDSSDSSSNPQMLLNGSRNEARANEAIPVVLGRYRIVAPVASINYITTDTDTSYLRMLLSWGYGPVSLSDMRVGATTISEYLDDITYISAYGYPTDNLSELYNVYGRDTFQLLPNLELPFTEPSGSTEDYITRVLSTPVNTLAVSFHFPQGLRGVYRAGGSAGAYFPTVFKVTVEVAELDPTTLEPVGGPGTEVWKYPGLEFLPKSITFGGYSAITGGFYGGSEGDPYYPYTAHGYVNHYIYLSASGTILVSSSNPYVTLGSTTAYVIRGNGLLTSVSTIPVLPIGATLMYKVITRSYLSRSQFFPDVGSTSIETVEDLRSVNGISGGAILSQAAISATHVKFSLDQGTSTKNLGIVSYGGVDDPFYLRKDAFTSTLNFSLDANNPKPYKVRIKRTTSALYDLETVDGTNKPYLYNKAYVYTITGTNSKIAPVIPPKNTNLALTAVKVRATNQLNGSLEGISAIVSSICMDYDIPTQTWVTRPTNNPAALFRYVLQHPANMQAISTAEELDKINLPAIEDWYIHCDLNNFTYNAAVVTHRSLLEVLKDICAAGMASPVLTEGKWTVVIDRPRDMVIQHFTPHNSWGFESTRTLAIPPHALRVSYVNATNSYQAEEITVFNYASKKFNISFTSGSSTATSSSPIVPSVDTSLGSTTLTVSFTQDYGVPAGTTGTVTAGSMSIALSIPASSTTAGLCEINVPYDRSTATVYESISLPGITDAGAVVKHAKFHLAQASLRPETYAINVDMEHVVCRRGDLIRVAHDVPMWGMSTGRIKNFLGNVSNVTTLELDEPVTMVVGTSYVVRIRTSEGISIVRSIQPVAASSEYATIAVSPALTSAEAAAGSLFMFGTVAKESAEMIVLGIEPSSNLTAKITFTDYSPQVYNSDVMYSAVPSFSTQITKPISYERNFIKSIPIINPSSIRSDESVMERSGNSYIYGMSVPFTAPTGIEKNITHVEYRVCLTNDTSISWRFVGTVEVGLGRVSVREVVEGLSYSIQLRFVSGSGYVGQWCDEVAHTIVGKATPPSNVTGFSALADLTLAKVRLSWNANSEIDIKGYEVRTDTNWGNPIGQVFNGEANTTLDTPGTADSVKTYYIKAKDYNNNYSITATTTTFVAPPPVNVTGVTYSFADTSLTSATVTIKWNNAQPLFKLSNYEITYDSTTVTGNSNNITLPANWLGSRTYVIKTVDMLGNKSTGTSVSISKLAPNPVTNFRAQVIDNNVMLYWDLPAITTLPVDHIILRKGTTWATSVLIGDKKGGFTSQSEIQGGTYTYWIAVVDTDGNQSTPASVTTKVSEPPDFVFHADYTSNFGATKNSAVLENSKLVLPVNTTETFEQHFTTRGWATPQAQIDAGYPIFIQPAAGSGYYEEVFDFGSLLSSSRVSLVYNGSIVSGAPTISTDIGISEDNITFSTFTGVSDIYATSFRYVRVRVTVVASNPIDVYSLNYLNVKLDAKLINDAGNVAANSADVLGTIVNFSKAFIDVTSITISANSSTAVTPVYDFVDAVSAVSYSVTSNLCTVTLNNHGLITGQKVRFYPSTGLGVSGVYPITGYTTNTFTIAMPVANTSGNGSIYMQSFRVYVFNSAGTRVTSNVSWSAKGY